ncbi:unnamed protein product [Trifolium pratense]|uniref:Uncharacterized protein n=1 Tax=Trifolium pratense TaxID=57577 RepID=A0ACB0IV20_TRIPR|nr:unnamed protein product [Trifolium pratense]
MEGNRINNRRCGGSRNESYNSQSHSSMSVPSSSVSRWGRLCRCGFHTILLTAKKGIHAGRQFWRCPFWMMPTTCNMFVWVDEEDEIFDVDEVDDGRIDALSKFFLGVIEDGRKKNEEVEKNLMIRG